MARPIGNDNRIATSDKAICPAGAFVGGHQITTASVIPSMQHHHMRSPGRWARCQPIKVDRSGRTFKTRAVLEGHPMAQVQNSFIYK
jgi:hypothetical protein